MRTQAHMHTWPQTRTLAEREGGGREGRGEARERAYCTAEHTDLAIGKNDESNLVVVEDGLFEVGLPSLRNFSFAVQEPEVPLRENLRQVLTATAQNLVVSGDGARPGRKTALLGLLQA